MRKKGVAPIILIISIVIVIVAGVGVYFLTTGEAPSKENLIVGYTGWSESGDWGIAFPHFAELYAEDIGLDTYYGNPEFDPTVQVDIMHHFVDIPVDMIIVPGLDMVSARDVVKKAKDEGIPTVYVNADLDSPDVAFSVIMSNYDMAYELGKLAVEYIRDEVEPIGEVKGAIFEARIPLAWQIGVDRAGGFEKAFEDYPDVEFVSIEAPDVAEVSKEKSTSSISAMMEEPVCVYAASGMNSYGLQLALDDLGMLYPREDERHIFFVAFDVNLANIESLRDNYIDYLNMQPVHFYHPLGMYYAKKIVEEGLDCLPSVGTIVTADDIDFGGGIHKGINPWADPMWAPGKVVMRYGHKSLEIQGKRITYDDYDDPYLWYHLLKATE